MEQEINTNKNIQNAIKVLSKTYENILKFMAELEENIKALNNGMEYIRIRENSGDLHANDTRSLIMTRFVLAYGKCEAEVSKERKTKKLKDVTELKVIEIILDEKYSDKEENVKLPAVFFGKIIYDEPKEITASSDIDSLYYNQRRRSAGNKIMKCGEIPLDEVKRESCKEIVRELEKI